MKTVSKTINAQLSSYHILEEKIKFLNAEKKLVKKHLITLMGDETTLDSLGYTATLITKEKLLLNTKLLKDSLGENLFKYQKPSISRTLTVLPRVEV